MYHIRLYENTGFNSVNVPFSKEYLTVAANKVYDSAVGDLSGFDGLLEPLDIIQNRNLASVRIHAPWSWVNQADYIVLYNHDAFEAGMTDTQKKNQVKDEIRDNGWCYIITNAVMANTDTATLSLTPDYLTSVNAALEIADPDNEQTGDLPIRVIDGIVSRSTWALNQTRTSGGLTVLDVDMNDSLLTPSGTLKLKTDRLKADTLGAGNGKTILLSTIDLGTAGTALSAKDFEVASTIGTQDPHFVTVPVLDYVDDSNSVSFGINSGLGTASPTQKYPGVCAVSYSNVTLGSIYKKALSNIRALGLESAIIAQYYIPGLFCESLGTGLVSTILGAAGTIPNNSEWGSNNVQVKTHNGTISKLLSYSPYEVLGIISPTGSKIEVHPQDLQNNGSPLTGVIDISYVADPRPNGKPYFTINGIHGVTIGITSLLFNCVEGLPWQNVPITWNQSQSGSALNTVRYNTTYSLNTEMMQLQKGNAASMFALSNKPLGSRVLNEIAQAEAAKHNSYAYPGGFSTNTDLYGGDNVNAYTRDNSFYDKTGGAFGIKQGSAADEWFSGWKYSRDNAAKAAGSSVGKASGWAADAINTLAHAPGLNALFGYDLKSQQFSNDQNEIVANYIKDSILDRLEYDISNTYYAPSISFPYGASIFDFLGNGIVRYKYVYTSDDVHRLTTILKAYGVQYKEYLSKKYFSSAAEVDSYDGGAKSTKFIYIQTSSATVSGRARWINEGVAAQLNNGVRFWKGKPRHIVPTTAEETGV